MTPDRTRELPPFWFVAAMVAGVPIFVLTAVGWVLVWLRVAGAINMALGCSIVAGIAFWFILCAFWLERRWLR